MTRAEFVAALPRKVAAAGALVTDAGGRVLLVRPTYKPGWEVPGGCVEQGESARAACSRELVEELALSVRLGRLLVVEHQTLADDKGDSIMFIYDGGTVAGIDGLTFADGEIDEARLVEPSRLVEFLQDSLSRRMAAAVRARREGKLVELVNGEVQPG